MKIEMTPITNVQEKAPRVQCITNFVTVNDCANIILAAGGSPSMSQDIREVEESVIGADAFVCNLGAIDYVDSMILAGKKANSLGIPVILDPVACGSTQLRRDLVAKVLDEVQFTVIRGNASEIRFLAGQETFGSGVDVSSQDIITEDNYHEAVILAKNLAGRLKCIVAISGSLDIVTDGGYSVIIHNGCPTMARITGSGCMLTALIGTYCGAMSNEPLLATVSAVTAMGVAGEIAEAKRLINKTGNATYRNDLIDAIFNMTEAQLMERSRYEVYER